MACQLIQITKPADRNRAEQEMLDFLRNLPGHYFVYRELQLNASYRDRVRGMEKKQPDYVIVAPEVGLISLEVKDWNLTHNTYAWRDQTKVQVTDQRTGERRLVDNPVHQSDTYLHALQELIRDLGVFITALVAFPRISWAEFCNRLEDVEVLRNPQSQFFLDRKRTLFREDLDRYVSRPEELLKEVVRRDRRFFASGPVQVDSVNRRLLPGSFRVGDYTNRSQHQDQLKVLSEQQQRWIFSLDPSYNYLLDVAGSGKTNVLISKALHTVDSAGNGHLPLILLTTYSANLETNIRRILQHKIADAEDRTRYLESIEVWCIPTLMEQMITAVYGLRSIEEYRTSGISPEAYEAELRKDVAEILRSEPDRFRRFDYIFVDEIQDFDNLYLQVVQHLCRTGHYFFVGDIGQKIYDRRHDLERLGFVTLKAEVAKSYKMYRTPRAIAELATRFILSDPLARSEFAERGYTESFRSQNTLWSVPEILRADLPEAEIPSRVEALLNEGFTESDILIITSAARLTITESRLQSAGIRYCLTESEHGKAVTLVEFMAAKGLEKEVVIVSGIEDLFERSKPDRLFDDEGIRRQQELLSRRKIYVALTRPLQQLIVYYQDSSNRFVADLLKINSEIINRV